MAIVDFGNGVYSLTVRGKLGLPNGFGLLRFGWSKFGYKNQHAAYYQKRKGKKGQIFVKERHYWPQNPRTPGQQAWRAIFATGVDMWHTLTPEEKAYYNNIKYPKGKTGFLHFMSAYLKSVQH